MNKAFDLLFKKGILIILLMLIFTFIKMNAYLQIVLFILNLIVVFTTESIILKIFGNFIFIGVFIEFLFITNDSSDMLSDMNILSFLAIILVMLILIIIQIYNIVYRIFEYNVINPPNTSGYNNIIKYFVKIIHLVDRIMSKVGLLIPFVYYIIITLLIIFIYSNMFNSLNNYYVSKDINNGLYMKYESINDESSDLGYSIYKNYYEVLNAKPGDSVRIPIVIINCPNKIDKIESDKDKESYISYMYSRNFVRMIFSDYAYFSATTFYTVGYGDVEIRGRIPKIVAQFEMLTAAIFNVIFIPLFFIVISNYLANRKQKVIKIN